MFSVRTDILRALAPCVSKEETRFYLNGIHLEPAAQGGVFAVATDGHKMGVFHDPDGAAPRHATIALDLRAPILRTPRDEASPRRLTFSIADGSAWCLGTVTATRMKRAREVDGRIIIREVGGDFPDWRRVVPSGEGGSCPSFNGNYIGDLAKASMAVSGADRQASYSVFARSADDPAVIRFHDVSCGFYVLMPVRNDNVKPFPVDLSATPVAAE